jgi:PmbA protein
MNKEEIYNLCEKISKKENVEFIYSSGKKASITFERFDVTKGTNIESTALYIRVIVNGQIGCYTITEINESNIRNGINKAKKIAKLKNDIKINDFGHARPNTHIQFDKHIQKIDFTNFIPEIKSELKNEKYITSYDGALNKIDHFEFYINPYTSKEENQSIINLGINVVTKDKTQSSGSYSDVFTKAEDINLVNTFNQAKHDANILLNPKSGDAGEYTLIFTPDVFNDVLSGLIIPGTIGEIIEKKESYLHEFVKKKIFSENLTINEEPHIDDFTGSCIMDDEGFKTEKKTIFDAGIFNTPIYDQYNAIKYHKKITGNGFRTGSTITCEYTNLIQLPGQENIEDIISKTKKGILVYSLLGIHTNKITTGDFSLVIGAGKEIINGEFKNTVTNLNFTGNLINTFKDIYFSKEQKFFGNGLYSFGVIPKIKLV